MIERQVIIRDLLYALRGIPTIYFRFESEQLNLSDEIPYPLASTLRPLCETCLLFHKLLNFLSTDFISDFGLQALSTVIRKFIPVYQTIISDFITRAEQNNLTIPHMLSELISPTIILKLFITLANEIPGVASPLNIVFEYCRYGDPLVRTYAADIYNQLRIPFNKLLNEWENEGSLSQDVHNDFFVTQIGNDEFVIDNEKVPIEFTSSKIDQIFKKGKSMHFIRKYCKDTSFDAASASYQDVHNYSREQLLQTQRLLVHLRGLRDYILLANGAYADALLRHDSKNFIFQNAGENSVADAHSFVLDAVSSMRSHNEDADVISRVDATLNTLDESIVKRDHQVWELFLGKYNLENSGVSYIVNPKSEQKYRKCFLSMWRLRLCMRLLSDSYLLTKELNINKTRFPEVLRCFDRMNKQILLYQEDLFRNKLMAVWEELEKKITVENLTLDEIESAHKNYLNFVFELIGRQDVFDALHSLVCLLIRFKSRVSVVEQDFQPEEFMKLHTACESFMDKLY